MSHSRSRGLAAAICIAAGLASPLRATAQTCSPSYKEVARAMYAQVLEMGGGNGGVDYWAGNVQGGTTVKQMVYENVMWQGYRDRFITGHDSRTVLTYLYRHLLAREPDDNAWGWATIGERDGWHVVIEGLMNSQEYNTRFGDHVLPGSPVVAWDCARATGIFEAHQNSLRDATQGAATVSYTTPAYVSLDHPRSLTFIYSSGLVSPNGLVQMNVVDNTGTPPDRVSIQLQVNGAWVTDEIVYHAGAGATRVAASIDGRDHRSVALPVTAVIRKYWPGGRTEAYSIATRAVIVNERYSQTGMGWVLAGMQELRNQGDGVLITESGTGTWFGLLGTDPNGDRRYASPAGDFSRVRWDAASGMYWRDYPDGSRARFRGDGRILDLADRAGNATQYGYGGSGELTRVIDPMGKETQLFYSGYGSLAAVQDPTGRRVTTGWYEAALYRFVEPDGAIAFDGHFYKHEGRWFLEVLWSAAGDRNAGAHTGHTVAYDRHWKLASVTAPQVNTTDAGTTRPVTQFRSLEAAVLAPAGTGTYSNPAPRVQPHEVRVEVTTARGNTTRMALDPVGAPTRVEEPLGQVTSILRDRHARVLRTDSPSGKTVLNEYVGLQLRRVINEATGSVMNAEYESVFNQPTHVWGTGGITEVWNTYDTSDPQRKLLSTRSGTITAPQIHYTWTTRGRVASVTDAEGHGTFYTYGDEMGANAWGNLHEVAAGTTSETYRRTTTMTYDGYGRTVAVTGPGGEVSRTVYDVMNRVTSAIGPQQDTTRYEHRATGLYRVTDPKGQSYVYNRNLLGWLESQIDARGQYRYYGYDRGGNPTSMTNRRGQTITSTFDALGRVSTRTADGQQTTWTYDPMNRWTQASNPVSTDRAEFDSTGRLARTITTRASGTYALDYAYDAAGRRTSLSYTGPWAGTRTQRFHYNAAGRLDTLTTVLGHHTSITYNADGLPGGLGISNIPGYINWTSLHKPSTIAYAGMVTDSILTTNYSYTPRGEMYERQQGATSRDFHRYGYDASGRLTTVSRHRYRDLDSLCGTDVDGNPVCPGGATNSTLLSSTSFGYDLLGNRTDWGRGITLDAGNRLTAMDGYTLSYDADGNLTRKLKSGSDDLTLSWNSLGQLVAGWRYGQGNTSYEYDALGRVARRTAPDGSIVEYVYDGAHVLLERTGSGQLSEYSYYPGIDKPHSLTRGGQTFYYATDQAGNVIGLMSGPETVTNQYRYNVWGVHEFTQESVPNPLRFAARPYDGVLGLYQVRARWYDPHTGRFVSEDPTGLRGGMNPYVYANNSPNNLRDPSGLKECENCLETVVVIGNRGDPGPPRGPGQGGTLSGSPGSGLGVDLGGGLGGGTGAGATSVSSALDGIRHDRCEVAVILRNYTSALRSNPTDFTDGTYPPEFDFKFDGTELSQDLYQVGNRWLRADEFGNFAAGYAGQSAFGAAGSAMMRVGGIWYASERNQHGERISGEHWSDRDSAPMINAGAARAAYDAGLPGLGVNYGVDSGYRLPPLTSTAGCN